MGRQQIYVFDTQRLIHRLGSVFKGAQTNIPQLTLTRSKTQIPNGATRSILDDSPFEIFGTRFVKRDWNKMFYASAVLGIMP